jgi:transketolase
MATLTPQLREQIENTIRFLTADAVQLANSGHPGAPMGLARPAFQLWDQHLRFDPTDAQWPLRDRFVLSNGHASMLLYSLLHLYGFDLSHQDIANFRKLGAKTPGHPEYGDTPGVEVTTGPLGQGFAHGVGMGLAAKATRARFGANGQGPGGHYVYAICGDGDLMEGISSEAGSLAGHLGLGNLIYLYDDNDITIDGPTSISFSEDVGKRFEAQRWHVRSGGGHEQGPRRCPGRGGDQAQQGGRGLPAGLRALHSRRGECLLRRARRGQACRACKGRRSPGGLAEERSGACRCLGRRAQPQSPRRSRGEARRGHRRLG